MPRPHSDLPELVVLLLAVAPQARRQGIARALMAEAQAYAKAARTPHLRLFVGAENTPAVQLYAALGFRPRSVELVWGDA